MSQAPINPNYAPLPAQRATGLAIASLVLGIISLFICLSWAAALCGVLAIIFGIIARNKVKEGTGGGDGMAKAGLIMGCIGLALDVIVIVLFFTIGLSFMKTFQKQIQQQQQQQQQMQQTPPATSAPAGTEPAAQPTAPSSQPQ
jgi:hypothetical protein